MHHGRGGAVVFTVIGIGNMGQSLMAGFFWKGFFTNLDVRIFDIDPDKI